jgi:hypothetical protein
MSAGEGGGYAARQGASPTQRRADALMALRFTRRSMIQPAPNGQASACKPPQRTPAVRWLVATAALARTDRWPFLEVKACTPLESAARGSRASTDPRKPRNLFNPAEGLSMEKPACASLRPPSKFVPVAALRHLSKSIRETSRKPLINRMYTLCEVMDSDRQVQPVRNSALSTPQNLLFRDCHSARSKLIDSPASPIAHSEGMGSSDLSDPIWLHQSKYAIDNQKKYRLLNIRKKLSLLDEAVAMQSRNSLFLPEFPSASQGSALCKVEYASI